MKRKQKFSSSFCFTVLAVPDSGLFAKGNDIVAGHSRDIIPTGEMPLFTRSEDARNHARGRANEHREKFPNDTHEWNFVVIPVLVSER
jgi:hypothetical protein